MSRVVSVCLLTLTLPILGPAATQRERNHERDSRHTFIREMPFSVRADHPAIVPVADAIRAVSADPLEQLIMVHDISHLLVDYDSDARVYGRVEYHATLDEMIQRRRQSGWVYLRDDCDGRAVFAAHLLANLGISWQLEASYWKRHAWISATVGGVKYDLLDLRRNDPELRTLSYRTLGRLFTRKSNLPPFFHWRRAWLTRTDADIEIGRRLGILELNSIAGNLRERFSVDWTKKVPDARTSPEDHRIATAPYAGFPHREPLLPSMAAVAAGTALADSSHGAALGHATGSAER